MKIEMSQDAMAEWMQHPMCNSSCIISMAEQESLHFLRLTTFMNLCCCLEISSRLLEGSLCLILTLVMTNFDTGVKCIESKVRVTALGTTVNSLIWKSYKLYRFRDLKACRRFSRAEIALLKKTVITLYFFELLKTWINIESELPLCLSKLKSRLISL